MLITVTCVITAFELFDNTVREIGPFYRYVN